MKIVKPLLLIPSLLMTSSLLCQHDDASILDQMLAENVRSLTVGAMNYDLVNAVYAPTSEEKDAFLRISTKETNGWTVRVLAPNGALMMTGLYADEELTVPNGRFTYFYVNGQVESSGLYQGGSKRGIWQRYNAWGEILVERIYEDLEDEGSKDGEVKPVEAN